MKVKDNAFQLDKEYNKYYIYYLNSEKTMPLKDIIWEGDKNELRNLYKCLINNCQLFCNTKYITKRIFWIENLKTKYYFDMNKYDYGYIYSLNKDGTQETYFRFCKSEIYQIFLLLIINQHLFLEETNVN